MSHKARRRPTWKNNKPFYIELIDENTGELMQTIKIKDSSKYLMGRLLMKYGKIETENKLRQAFIDLAEQYKGDTL